jgi:hypothetical protein
MKGKPLIMGKSVKSLFHFNGAPEIKKWNRISCKQTARWQHLSQLKAGVLLSWQKI